MAKPSPFSVYDFAILSVTYLPFQLLPMCLSYTQAAGRRRWGDQMSTAPRHMLSDAI